MSSGSDMNHAKDLHANCPTELTNTASPRSAYAVTNAI